MENGGIFVLLVFGMLFAVFIWNHWHAYECQDCGKMFKKPTNTGQCLYCASFHVAWIKYMRGQ